MIEQERCVHYVTHDNGLDHETFMHDYIMKYFLSSLCLKGFVCYVLTDIVSAHQLFNDTVIFFLVKNMEFLWFDHVDFAYSRCIKCI